VFRDVDRPEYAEAANRQIADAQRQKGPGDLQALLRSGATWTVE
jgi:2-oxoglutarate ferredoxin oxidoreductase subunit beta